MYEENSEDNSESHGEGSLQSSPEPTLTQMQLAAVSQAHPNLMAQEMLRDMARMAQEQALVKPEPGLIKTEPVSSASSPTTTTTTSPELPPQRSEILAGLKVKSTLGLKDTAAAAGMQQNGYYGNSKVVDGARDDSAEVESDVQIMTETYGANRRKSHAVPTRKIQDVAAIRSHLLAGSRTVKTEDPTRPEDTCGVRKPRKGTPVKLCSTPPTVNHVEDLSHARRQIFTDMPPLDGPYEEDEEEAISSGEVSQSEDYGRLTIVTEDEPTTMNIGTMKVPIQPQYKDARQYTRPGAKVEQHEPQQQHRSPPPPPAPVVHTSTPAPSTAPSTFQPLDLTSPVKDPTGKRKEDILVAVAASDASSTLAQCQTLLLNGKEYEIVPVGTSQWITRNEYEMMKELSEVHKPKTSGVRSVPLKVPQIKLALKSAAALIQKNSEKEKANRDLANAKSEAAKEECSKPAQGDCARPSEGGSGQQDKGRACTASEEVSQHSGDTTTQETVKKDNQEVSPKDSSPAKRRSSSEADSSESEKKKAKLAEPEENNPKETTGSMGDQSPDATNNNNKGDLIKSKTSLEDTDLIEENGLSKDEKENCPENKNTDSEMETEEGEKVTDEKGGQLAFPLLKQLLKPPMV